MMVLRCGNLSDVRLQKTAYETSKDIEQLMPGTTAISCHFRLCVLDRSRQFADHFNERTDLAESSCIIVGLLPRPQAGQRYPAAAGFSVEPANFCRRHLSRSASAPSNSHARSCRR